MPMSKPRRSFCFSPLSSLLQRFRRVFTLALLRPLLSSSLRLLQLATLFFFPFISLLLSSLSLLHATFGLLCWRPMLNLVYARRRDGRAEVTSVADFKLECSHLESVFSCTGSIDIFSQQTSRLSEFFVLFRLTRKFSLGSFIEECAQKLVVVSHSLFL